MDRMSPRPIRYGGSFGSARSISCRRSAGARATAGKPTVESIKGINQGRKGLPMYALSVMGENSRMGVIVAAPTAGGAGVLPAVLTGLAAARRIGD